MSDISKTVRARAAASSCDAGGFVLSGHPPPRLASATAPSCCGGDTAVTSCCSASTVRARRNPPRLGAKVRFFYPSGLPLFDDGADTSHPKVRELRALAAWSEGMVWSSPERGTAL
jgi:hypothetical protein